MKFASLPNDAALFESIIIHTEPKPHRREREREMATEEEEEEKKLVAPRLIEKATHSTAADVDPRLLKAIKSSARSDDRELRAALRSLLDYLKKPHSQVRYLSILIIDELFMRSKLFRSLLAVNLDQILTLCVGFRRDAPLPPPAPVAATLRKKTIELLEKWHDAFGVHYRQLRLGFHYLKNIVRLQFPDHQATAARAQRERRERELRTQEILLAKFENLKQDFDSIKDDIQSLIDEIIECLEIVNVKDEDEAKFAKNVDENEEEEFHSISMRQIRIDALKESKKIRETSENRPILDTLRELLKLLVSKHLVSVQNWISVLIRVDLSDNSFRDIALKEMIDFRNSIQIVRNKCSQLGCVINDKPREQEEEEEENLWEEGKIEEYVPEVSDSFKEPAENSAVLPAKDKGKSLSANLDEIKPLDSMRAKLLTEAPVLTWDRFLDNWGSRRDVLANQRGLELDGHWGRVDYDAVIPAEKIAELSVHRTVYKEEPIEIRPCLAPLKRGGLCQRRDLKACPFHGPIVPRDAQGNPLECVPNNEEESKQQNSTNTIDHKGDLIRADEFHDLGEVTVAELANKAVKNVRKREEEMKALKRAKHANVRKHNERVLREAAIASTSYPESLLNHANTSLGRPSRGKAKNPTLASMLKKKETAKDRIAQRLLNTRVSDAASRQLMQAEHSNYHEAFPNQW